MIQDMMIDLNMMEMSFKGTENMNSTTIRVKTRRIFLLEKKHLTTAPVRFLLYPFSCQIFEAL